LLEDLQLIAQVRNGNTDAFGQIIERYPVIRGLKNLFQSELDWGKLTPRRLI